MDNQRLTKIIRSKIKSQGVTLGQLAQRLEISEPTVKRWVRGEGVNLEQWLNLLDTLGLSLADVATVLDEPQSRQFLYTEKQEQKLAETPGLLAFFQALLAGDSPRQIGRRHKLQKSSITFYLRTLDNIDLIKWTKELTCRLKVSGEPKWRAKGPLAKAFRKQMFNEFVYDKKDCSDLKLAVYDLSRDDLTKLNQMVEEVLSFAQSAETKARLLKIPSSPIGVAIASGPYSPEFLFSIPTKK